MQSSKKCSSICINTQLKAFASQISLSLMAINQRHSWPNGRWWNCCTYRSMLQESHYLCRKTDLLEFSLLITLLMRFPKSNVRTESGHCVRQHVLHPLWICGTHLVVVALWAYLFLFFFFLPSAGDISRLINSHTTGGSAAAKMSTHLLQQICWSEADRREACGTAALINTHCGRALQRDTISHHMCTEPPISVHVSTSSAMGWMLI